MKKRIAQIGCGGIGRYHFSHLVEFDDVELVGFCDLIRERAENFAADYGSGGVYTDYKRMLDEEKPDAVFIGIPPYAHGEIELELIARGIHFFVEKPVALDMGLARRIRDGVKAAGLITACGFQCRYSKLVAPNLDFVRKNEIVSVTCTRLSGIPGVDWWKDKTLSGGQAVEQTIHQFDIIRYMLGEPETVFSFGSRGFVKGVADYNTDDVSVTAIKFKSGALASIMTGCYASGGAAAENKVTFSAKNARADLKILENLVLYGVEEEKEERTGGFVTKDDGAIRSGGGKTVEYREEGDAGIPCDRTFIDALFSGDASKIRSPYEDAVKSLAFTLACNISMDTGKAVNIDELL